MFKFLILFITTSLVFIVFMSPSYYDVETKAINSIQDVASDSELIEKRYLLIDCGKGNIIYSSIREEDGALAINAYFKEKNVPLAGYGDVFIRISQKWRLDWRLLPAIAFRESTGGKFLFRPYNPFGWGRRSFYNFTEAINEVAKNLSGNDLDTRGFYYGKTTMQKLRIYNSELYTYPEEVWWIMNDIAEQVAKIERWKMIYGGP